MRVRGTTFYYIFEKIELNWAQKLGRSALAPRYVTMESADWSQVYSLRVNKLI